MFEWDREVSRMRRPWFTRGFRAMEKLKYLVIYNVTIHICGREISTTLHGARTQVSIPDGSIQRECRHREPSPASRFVATCRKQTSHPLMQAAVFWEIALLLIRISWMSALTCWM